MAKKLDELTRLAIKAASEGKTYGEFQQELTCKTAFKGMREEKEAWEKLQKAKSICTKQETSDEE